MNYLFIHQNFPGQYRHVASHLAAQPDNQVLFITQPNDNSLPFVRKVTYGGDQRGPVNCHVYSLDVDRAIHIGAQVADVCRALKQEGFRPDLIVGHCGWGETLFVKDVYPDVPLLGNFEFYYHPQGVDVGFDPEFESLFSDPSRLRARNAVSLLAFQGCDWGHTATAWQHSLQPAELRPRISVLHEGVDVRVVSPRARARFCLPSSSTTLRKSDEVITFVSRNLEPYRGFHVFMRALPELLQRRPRAQVVIVGGDGVSYGAPAPPQSSFRALLLAELGDRLDLSRVHFVGKLDYRAYLDLLRVSSVHVYLTYPFVLSWSFIEAMACGCAIVGSATPPVLEVLQDGVNGRVVDFFDSFQIAARVDELLQDTQQADRLRAGARATALERFDLRNVLMPRWLSLFEDLMTGRLTRSMC